MEKYQNVGYVHGLPDVYEREKEAKRQLVYEFLNQIEKGFCK